VFVSLGEPELTLEAFVTTCALEFEGFSRAGKREESWVRSEELAVLLLEAKVLTMGADGSLLCKEASLLKREERWLRGKGNGTASSLIVLALFSAVDSWGGRDGGRWDCEVEVSGNSVIFCSTA
jgi:hypothetical protein